MKEITMKKSTLIDTIKKNLEVHVKEYKEMHVLYSIKAIELTKELLSKVEKDATGVYLAISLTEPTSSEESYNTALEMLELEVNDTVTISEKEFKQYIKDEWNWSHSFAISKTAYLN